MWIGLANHPCGLGCLQAGANSATVLAGFRINPAKTVAPEVLRHCSNRLKLLKTNSDEACCAAHLASQIAAGHAPDAEDT